MVDNIESENYLYLKNYLSKCVNTSSKTFYNRELILNLNTRTKQIVFITYGHATITKIDEDGNKVVLRELKENDIFSNLFYLGSEDEIYVVSNSNITEVIFINYYSILKDCSMNCPFHNQLVLSLFDLLIKDNKELNEKIELLSKRTVRSKILFFLKKRINNDNIFRVTTSYKAIADYLSIDRSNFMRELSNLEKEGIIKKEGRKITFLQDKINNKFTL